MTDKLLVGVTQQPLIALISVHYCAIRAGYEKSSWTGPEGAGKFFLALPERPLGFLALGDIVVKLDIHSRQRVIEVEDFLVALFEVPEQRVLWTRHEGFDERQVDHGE